MDHPAPVWWDAGTDLRGICMPPGKSIYFVVYTIISVSLGRQGDVCDAMHTTLTGTGGALVGSAATTVSAFGTLAFAIFPLLQQFGIITGLTIIYR